MFYEGLESWTSSLKSHGVPVVCSHWDHVVVDGRVDGTWRRLEGEDSGDTEVLSQTESVVSG